MKLLKSQIYFSDWSHIMSIMDKCTLLYRHNMWLQQDIDIWKKIIFKMKKCENFVSLALLARNNLWNFSSLRSFFPIKAISWALRKRYIIIPWLTNKILRYQRIVQFKRRKFRLSRSLRSLVIINEISQVSDVFLWIMTKAISWVLCKMRKFRLARS